LSKDLSAIMEKMRGSFASREDANHFKQIGIAIHNYHDANKRFPFADPANGDPFSKDLSWRVRLMPYMERHPEYERMDLSKGWQAPANQAAIKNCRDSYVISTGGLVCTIKTERDVKSFHSIADGTSNTIMLIENRKAAMSPWTQPLDLDIDDAVKLVTSLQKGDFIWVGLYDGSVRKLHSIKETDITEKEIRCLFDPRDGKSLDLDSIFDRLGS
ncbi:MAG: DUF1559 domain-containing protein, partial [Planctomycetota bacterium]|nr:DUF1559 domain-containing protein [Planctomycetota bacterium]